MCACVLNSLDAPSLGVQSSNTQRAQVFTRTCVWIWVAFVQCVIWKWSMKYSQVLGGKFWNFGVWKRHGGLTDLRRDDPLWPCLVVLHCPLLGDCVCVDLQGVELWRNTPLQLISCLVDTTIASIDLTWCVEVLISKIIVAYRYFTTFCPYLLQSDQWTFLLNNF